MTTLGSIDDECKSKVGRGISRSLGIHSPLAIARCRHIDEDGVK